MIDWTEVQALYNHLNEARDKLAWARSKDPELERIKKTTYDAITAQMEALEQYVAPFREPPA